MLATEEKRVPRSFEAMVAKRHWFLRKVWRTVHEHAMLREGDRVIVAVSGGADSVATLLALHAFARPLSLQLTVAHVDHGLRATSSEDRQFVVSLAAKLGLPVRIRELSPGALGKSNLEAQARLMRYRFLHEVAASVGGAKIATGHTMDDQAETVLLRLLRGSGLRGLRGVLPVRSDSVIRPLIGCTRAEARRFLQEQGCSWREDETNQDDRFLRNRVRLQLLPILCSWNPSLVRVLARTADVARVGAQALEWLVREKLEAATQPDGTLCLSFLRGLDPAVQSLVVATWLAAHVGEAVRPSERQRLRVLAEAFVHRSGSSDTGKVRDRALRISLVWQDDRVKLQSEPTGFPSSLREATEWKPVPLVVGGAVDLPNGWRIWAQARTCTEKGVAVRLRDELVAIVDARALDDCLLVRPVSQGDRIVPIGMVNARKVQDVFTDRQVPREERWGRPAVVCGTRIIWIPGVIRSAHALVTSETRDILELRAARHRP